MRVFLILTLFALVGLCISSPINPQRQLVNRPTRDQIFRGARSSQVKGHGVIFVKGGASSNLPKNLRKGEYVCGSKICKLKPGELPRGCEDQICQYPLPLGPAENFPDLMSS